MGEFDKNFVFSLKDKLNMHDAENQTYGCRHSNSSICGASFIEGICAFSSQDHICRKPPATWKKYYKKLLTGGEE